MRGPLALLVALLPLACSRAPAVERPNVLLISLDTLRADVPLTSLAALSAESSNFSRAYVPMPFTLPAHMSMMTGLYPESHFVVLEGHTLTEPVVTLAAALQSVGYRTVGIHTNDWLQEGFGFGRGFDDYRMLPAELTYADRVTRAALEQVDWSPARGPVFAFLHYMDAHSDSTHSGGNTLPYYAPPEDLRDFPVDPAAFCDADHRCATEFLQAADDENRDLSEDERARVEGLYRRGIRFLDRQLGALIAGLRERGVWESLMVVVVSDHGEEFREHGKLLHSQPYDETIRVPLVVRLPETDRRGQTIDVPVSIVDIMPTILDYLGAPVPAVVQGRSLLPLIEKGEPQQRLIVSQDKLDRKRFALVRGPNKLIMNLATGDTELYDLERDPRERRNLAESSRLTVRQLAELLVEQVRDSRRLKARLHREAEPSEPQSFGPEARERLKALGYIE